MKTTNKTLRGVTLVEIAIVLVIIGLLLGGILKGQELINNAKVRSIADRQNSLKAAWFAFLDRFQALPGDFVYAAQYIPGAGDGQGDGNIDEQESAMVFQHLTGAGYLRCPQCTATVTNVDPSARNSLQNQYGGVMAIFSDESYYATTGATQRRRLMIHTGPRIPSGIISEVDRKIDDGVANTGDFIFNEYDTGSIPPLAAQCVTSSQDEQTDGALLGKGSTMWWRHANAGPPVEQNCGGAVNI